MTPGLIALIEAQKKENKKQNKTIVKNVFYANKRTKDKETEEVLVTMDFFNNKYGHNVSEDLKAYIQGKTKTPEVVELADDCYVRTRIDNVR